MMISRRRLLGFVAALALLPMLGDASLAQDYPSQTVRIVVGFPAGSSADIVARLMAEWLNTRLGQRFIVENRPGAASNVATEAVVRSPPDGYTLLWTTPANAISQSFYDNLTFNFLRDTTPVASVMKTPLVVMVSPKLPVSSMPELISYAKAHPGKVNMASGGNGGTPHVSGELLKMMAGINLTHVPYRGDAPAMTDLLGGQVDVMVGIMSASLETIRSGQLRALAVTTATRSDVLPALPAVSEFLPGYEAIMWHGVIAPKNTPPAVVERLNKEINAALADETFKARLAAVGAQPMAMSPREFGNFTAAETEKWSKVVQFSGAKAGAN